MQDHHTFIHTTKSVHSIVDQNNEGSYDLK